MAFVGDGQKLIGNDGSLYGVELGDEVTGDGITALTEGDYVITAIDPGTSGWPGTSGAAGATSVEVGRVVEVRATDTAITPSAADKYVPLTVTELCDISSWSLPFTADEIEITTFCDGDKKYRAGKDDANGTMSGIFTIGITDKVTGLAIARNFADIVRQDGGDSIDVYEKLKGAKLVKLILNKVFDNGDWIEYIAPVELFSFTMSAEQGANAQTFDSSFRLTNLNVGAASVSVLPGLYRRARSEENT